MSLSKSTANTMKRQRVVSVNLLQYSNETRSEGYFNDVTILVGNHSIPANRMVLSCHSVFFEKMFRCEMKEKYEHNIELHSVNGKSVKNLIDYIYEGSIDIDKENVMNLITAADYLQLHDVKQFCFEYLKSIITIDNWFDIFRVVILFRGDEIKNQVYHYISTHFNEISQTDDFKELSNEELKECISNFDRNKVKETSIYRGIINWIKHNPEERKTELFCLFQLMKIDQLPYEFIEEEVLEEDLIRDNFDCHRFIVTTFLKSIRNQKDEVHGSKLISVGGRRTRSKVIEVHSLHGKSLIEYPDFPVNIRYHSLLKVNDYIYCIGGLNSDDLSKSSNKVWAFNVKDRSMKWREVAQMNEKRYLMGATEHNGTLVVAGGSNGVNSLKSAEFYKMTLNIWKPISSMNQYRHNGALVSCKGCLYALGGRCDKNASSSSVERWTDFEGTWKNIQPMQKPRRWLVAVNCDNVVYAIGGQCGDAVNTSTKTVEKYTPNDDKWVYVSEMNTERYLHAACVMRGKIYVVGGVNADNHVVQTIECYDPALDSWKITGETSEQLFSHSIVAL